VKRPTDESKRRGIQGGARELRKELARAGQPITQEAAVRRTRGAVVRCEKKRER